MSGIGRATAIALAEAGWSISLLARRADKLQETKQLCREPSKVLLFEGDVTKEDDVSRLFRDTLDRFGTFGVLPYKTAYCEADDHADRRRSPEFTIQCKH